jgi:uncharacterized glyoxalase superfamily protein PhnB
MSKNTGDTLPNIFPVIRYRNAPAAIAWLIEAFGFEKWYRVLRIPSPTRS